MAQNNTLNELTAQPQALEAEQAVLGSMLTTKEVQISTRTDFHLHGASL